MGGVVPDIQHRKTIRLRYVAANHCRSDRSGHSRLRGGAHRAYKSRTDVEMLLRVRRLQVGGAVRQTEKLRRKKQEKQIKNGKAFAEYENLSIFVAEILTRFLGRVVRRRSAKPFTAVRFC